MNLESPKIAKGTYQHVLSFLETWLDWAEDFAIGKVDTTLGYSAGFGLCSNATKYQNKANAYDEHGKIGLLVRNALGDIFAMNRMHRDYPFHKTRRSYDEECTSHSCHLNPERLAWVKEAITNLKELLHKPKPESKPMSTNTPLLELVQALIDEHDRLDQLNKSLNKKLEELQQKVATQDALLKSKDYQLEVAGYQFMDTPNYRKHIHKKLERDLWIPLYKKV